MNILIDEKKLSECMKRWQWYVDVETRQYHSDGTDPMSKEYLKGKIAAWEQMLEELKDILKGENSG